MSAQGLRLGPLAVILALAGGHAFADDGEDGNRVPHPTIEALGPLQGGGMDLPLALLRPRSQDDVAAIVGRPTTTLPALIVLARDLAPEAPVSLGVAAVGSLAGCVVVTWLEGPPEGAGGGGVPALQAWAIHAAAPPAVLLRRAPHGSDPAAPPAAARGPERAARRARLDLPWPSLGVLLDPLGRDLGLVAAFERLRSSPPAGVDDPVALLVARPTDGGRRLGEAACRSLEGGAGLRVHVALPLDPGPTAWGPRARAAADALFVPRAEGERCEWLLRLE